MITRKWSVEQSNCGMHKMKSHAQKHSKINTLKNNVLYSSEKNGHSSDGVNKLPY